MIRWVRTTDAVRIGFTTDPEHHDAFIVVSRLGLGNREHRITLVHPEHRTYGEMTAQSELTRAFLDGDPHATEFVIEHLWADCNRRDDTEAVSCSPNAWMP